MARLRDQRGFHAVLLSTLVVTLRRSQDKSVSIDVLYDQAKKTSLRVLAPAMESKFGFELVMEYLENQCHTICHPSQRYHQGQSAVMDAWARKPRS